MEWLMIIRQTSCSQQIVPLQDAIAPDRLQPVAGGQ